MVHVLMTSPRIMQWLDNGLFESDSNTKDTFLHVRMWYNHLLSCSTSSYKLLNFSDDGNTSIDHFGSSFPKVGHYVELTL